MNQLKFIFFSSILPLAIINAHAKSSTFRDSVKNYYEFKNKAEMAIVEGNYTMAASLYNEAFKYKKRNPRDDYNAFVVYFITGDSVNCKKSFDNLLMLGFTKEKLEWMPFIDSIKNKPVYSRYIASDTQEFYARYYKSENYIYSHILDSLYSVDQSYRDNEGKTSIDYDSLNASFVIRFTNSKEVPSMINVGFDKYFGMRPDREGTLFLLYLHWRGEKSPLDTLLKRAVLDGTFDPSDYAFQRDYGAKNKYYHQILNYNMYDLDAKTIDSINKQRAAIYLAPLDEYFKKMEFSIQNKTFAFFDQMLVVVNRQLKNKQ